MSPGTQFWLSFSTQLLIGLSTLGAVVVALFGDWIRYWLIPPKLSIRLRSETSEEINVAFMAAGQPNVTTLGRWYHVRVDNTRRWIKAEDVQVFLLRIEEPDASGQFTIQWEGAIPLEWRYMRSLNPAATRTLGHYAEADLVALFKRGNTTPQPFLQLKPLITPSRLEPLATRTTECKFRVLLQARGTHVDSDYLTVEIAWKGFWPETPDDMRRALVVKEI